MPYGGKSYPLPQNSKGGKSKGGMKKKKKSGKKMGGYKR